MLPHLRKGSAAQPLQQTVPAAPAPVVDLDPVPIRAFDWDDTEPQRGWQDPPFVVKAWEDRVVAPPPAATPPASAIKVKQEPSESHDVWTRAVDAVLAPEPSDEEQEEVKEPVLPAFSPAELAAAVKKLRHIALTLIAPRSRAQKSVLAGALKEAGFTDPRLRNAAFDELTQPEGFLQVDRVDSSVFLSLRKDLRGASTVAVAPAQPVAQVAPQSVPTLPASRVIKNELTHAQNGWALKSMIGSALRAAGYVDAAQRSAVLKRAVDAETGWLIERVDGSDTYLAMRGTAAPPPAPRLRSASAAPPTTAVAPRPTPTSYASALTTAAPVAVTKPPVTGTDHINEWESMRSRILNAGSKGVPKSIIHTALLHLPQAERKALVAKATTGASSFAVEVFVPGSEPHIVARRHYHPTTRAQSVGRSRSMGRARSLGRTQSAPRARSRGHTPAPAQQQDARSSVVARPKDQVVAAVRQRIAQAGKAGVAKSVIFTMMLSLDAAERKNVLEAAVDPVKGYATLVPVAGAEPRLYARGEVTSSTAPMAAVSKPPVTASRIVRDAIDEAGGVVAYAAVRHRLAKSGFNDKEISIVMEAALHARQGFAEETSLNGTPMIRKRDISVPTAPTTSNVASSAAPLEAPRHWAQLIPPSSKGAAQYVAYEASLEASFKPIPPQPARTQSVLHIFGAAVLLKQTVWLHLDVNSVVYYLTPTFVIDSRLNLPLYGYPAVRSTDGEVFFASLSSSVQPTSIMALSKAHPYRLDHLVAYWSANSLFGTDAHLMALQQITKALFVALSANPEQRPHASNIFVTSTFEVHVELKNSLSEAAHTEVVAALLHVLRLVACGPENARELFALRQPYANAALLQLRASVNGIKGGSASWRDLASHHFFWSPQTCLDFFVCVGTVKTITGKRFDAAFHDLFATLEQYSPFENTVGRQPIAERLGLSPRDGYPNLFRELHAVNALSGTGNTISATDITNFLNAAPQLVHLVREWVMAHESVYRHPIFSFAFPQRALS